LFLTKLEALQIKGFIDYMSTFPRLYVYVSSVICLRFLGYMSTFPRLIFTNKYM